jgi:hypothetical protein
MVCIVVLAVDGIPESSRARDAGNRTKVFKGRKRPEDG